MMDLRDLYQEVILDHNRSPRNYHAMSQCSCSSEGFNPLCGDQVKLFLKINNGCITAASFTGHGCAISIASASLMTESIIGKTEQKVESLFQDFRKMLIGSEDFSSTKLEKLSVLSGVKKFPSRVKCATLVWHTLQAALHHSAEVATTE